MNQRKRDILHFIETYREKHGVSPTIREIGAGVGLSSSSSVHLHIVGLREMGYLTYQFGKVRTLRTE